MSSADVGAKGKDPTTEAKPVASGAVPPLMTMGTTSSADGTIIHYDVCGAEGAPLAMLLVHGWSCNRSHWDAQVNGLIEAGGGPDRCRVVRVDIAGHGASEARIDWSIAAFGADVAAVADALSLDTVVLVGHSLGGMVILEAARLLGRRVVGLVGVETLSHVDVCDMKPDWVEAKIAQLHSDFHAAMSSSVDRGFLPDSNPEAKKRVLEDFLNARPEAVIPTYPLIYSYDARPGLEDLSVPLVLMNKNDTQIESTRSRVKNFQFVNLGDVGHFPMLEKPEAFTEELKRVVAGLIGN